MKILLTLTLIAGTATALLAQGSATPTGSPTALPPGPLFKPFPSQIRWTITRKGEGAASQAASQKAPDAGGTKANEKERAGGVDIQIIGEKVGDISHTVTIYASGLKMEVWKTRSQEITMRPGWRVPMVSQSTPDAGEDLGWISESNYQGVQPYSGTKCMIFRGKIVPANMAGAAKIAQTTREQLKITNQDALPEELKQKPEDLIDPSTYEVDAVACIDFETRLPIALQVGKVVTTYKYQALPPDYTLSLPNEIASAMQTREKQVQATSRRPVLP